MGYQEIELSYGPGYDDFYGHPPAELNKILADLSLKAPSCHYRSPADDTVWQSDLEIAHTLGVEYMICSTPPKQPQSQDDWKRVSELFNHLAEATHKAGIQFGYHNHNSEFRLFDGIRGYDILLRETDKNLVKMQMDCFWATFAGADPVLYFEQHPGRFPILHIKDLKPGYAPDTGHFDGNPFTEVGTGIMDWKRIFAAAPKGGVKHYFVEQDMWDRPSLESARISADYLKKLKL